MAEMEVLLERQNRFGAYLEARLGLPASKVEIEDVLQRVRAEDADDYTITLSSSSLHLKLPENARLDELNYLAARLAKLDDYGIGGLQAFVQFDEAPLDMKRLINMTFNPDYLESVYAGNWAMVGEHYLGGELFDNLPDEVYELLDDDKVGKYVAKIEGGKLCENGYYVFPTGKEFEEVYDGVTLPPIMGLLDEDEYVFKLLVAEAPVNHSEETIDSAVWITLPGDLE